MHLTPNAPPWQRAGLLDRGLAFALLTLVACLPSAVLADVGCLMKVEVKQALGAPQSGWTAGLDKLPTEAAGISVFEGPPEEMADLVPDDGKDAADTRSDIWNLPQSEHGYWLVCHYSNTTVTLARQLPATVTRCEAVYEKQQTFAGGAPVVRSVKCGPGGP
jgi:hypothetical protein